MRPPFYAAAIGLMLLLSGCGGGGCDGSTGPGCGQTHTLQVSIGPGVTGTPAAGTSAHADGEKVSYAFSTSAGYDKLRVFVDGDEAAASATLTLDRDRTIVAVADSVLETSQQDSALGRQLTTLLSGSPLPAYRALQTSLDSLTILLGLTEANRRLRLATVLAFDPARDAGPLSRALAEIEDSLLTSGGAAAIGAKAVRPASAVTPEVTFIYINGINTLIEEGQHTTSFFIVPSVNEAGFSDRGRYPVVYVPNRTSSETPAAREKWTCLTLASLRVLTNSWASALLEARRCFQVGGILGVLDDLEESTKQVVNILFASLPSLAQEDALRLADMMAGAVRAGSRVVVISHSQGNLMATEALGQLARTLAPEELACVGVVAIAPPVSVHIAPGQEYVSSLIVGGTRAQDVLLTFGLGLTADRLTNEASENYDRFGAMWLVPFMNVMVGVDLHGIELSYLGQEATRRAIRNRIHDQAAGVLTRCPPTTGGPHLDFTTQPATQPVARKVFPAGYDIHPAIEVTAFDAGGTTISSYADPVSLELSANPCGGALAGGGAVTPSGGVATFAHLRVDHPCHGLILAASSASATAGFSAAFDVGIPGDLDLDGLVGSSDTTLLLADLGRTDRPPADIDKNGAVDVLDLGILLNHWTVATGNATDVSTTSVRVNGAASPNWRATSVWFEWGTDPALGTFSSTPHQAIGSGTVSQNFSADLSGLAPGTTYWVRAVASSAAGVVRDPDVHSFRTEDGAGSGILFAESGVWSGFNSLPPSDLYRVETGESGTDGLIGRIRTASSHTPIITDIARSPSGTMYAISFDKLYALDASSGIVTEIGGLGLAGTDGAPNALAFDGVGTLFGATSIGSFFRVDVGTGQATILGSFGGGMGAWGDIVFAPDGTLYGTARISTGGSVLVTIDPVSGQATEVQPGSSLGFENVWGLAFVGDELFGLTTESTLVQTATGTLLRIDVHTGGAAVVRKLSFDAAGGT